MKRSRKLYLLLLAIFLFSFFAISLVYIGREVIWRYCPRLRIALAGYIVADKRTIGISKDAVVSKLGKCDKSYDGYAIYVFDRQQVDSPFLIFDLDPAHRVLGIRFGQKDFTPSEKRSYKLSAWGASNVADRIAMSRDIIERWQTGDLLIKLSTLNDVLRDFPETKFVDCWLYKISEWESVVIGFAPDGTVSKIEYGGDD
jgi:hypothetical protein